MGGARRRLLHIACILALAVGTLGLVSTDGDTSDTGEATAPSATIGGDLDTLMRLAADGERLEVVVTFHERTGMDRLNDVDAPAQALEALPMAGAYLTADEIAEVATWPEVRSVYPNLELTFHHDESVPMTGAPEVWDLGYTGEGVTVYVHDSGIDGTHPDLSYPDKTVQNVKIAHTRFAYWSHGIDTQSESVFIEDQPHTDTTIGHGTHVAGTVAGAGEADPDRRGMAPGATLVGMGAGDGIRVYQALQGYDWLFIEHDGVPNHEIYDITVVNNSWGTSTIDEFDVDGPIEIATYEAYAAGMTVVFSAGNSGPGPDSLNPYATAPWTIGVAAVDKDRQLAGFSSRGYPNHPLKAPDVAAVGVNVSSANYYAWPVDPYRSANGTSMSAPHVSGLVALLLEANPDLSPDQVADIIRETTQSLDRRTWEAGTGFIDAVAAVETALATEGERDGFLAGDTAHTLESAAATVADDLPYERVEEDWSGEVGPSAGVLVWSDDHTFEVSDETEFLNVLINWDRGLDDLDLILTSPSGTTYQSPTGEFDRVLGPLYSAKIVRVLQPEPGEWTATARGFASAVTPYEGRIVAYEPVDGTNWPEPDDEADDDATLNVSPVFFYKQAPYVNPLGIGSTYFRSGDGGFYVFDVLDDNGIGQSGLEIDVHFVDRDGEIVDTRRADDEGGGEYRVRDLVFDDGWDGPSGAHLITYSLPEADEELAFEPFRFFLNHLEVNAETLDADGEPRDSFAPGETIHVEGDVAHVNTYAVQDLEYDAALGADVTVALLDLDGEVVDEVATTAGLLTADFSAELTVPEDVDGLQGVAIVATQDDATLLVGPGDWYGEELLSVGLPLLATLDVDPQTVSGGDRTVTIAATVAHGDGVDALEHVELTVTGSNGRVLERWTADDFQQVGDGTLELTTEHRMVGPAPWEVRLHVVDVDGNEAEQQQTVERE